MKLSDAIGLELERREKMANKCNHNFGDEDSCCKCGQFWWDVLAERKANIDALTIEVGELYHDIERYIAITSEQQVRIEALEKAATEVVECGVDAMAYDRRQVLDALAALLQEPTP